MAEILGVADLDAAYALSEAEGWNQTTADWRRLVDLEPDGCFAVRNEGQLVGTVTTTTYDDSLAWIGMMIVRRDRRRHGIGATLMRQALDHLRRRGVTTVRLDATPAGQPLYESLGFVAEVQFERWQGLAARSSGNSTPVTTAASRQCLIAADATGYGVNRSRLIDALVDCASIDPISINAGTVSHAGFALARPGRAATYVGPIVASTSRDAEQLLDAALGQLGGHEVCLDRHVGGLLDHATLAAHGLTKRRVLVRMRYGAPNAAGTAQSVCCSAGPEYG